MPDYVPRAKPPPITDETRALWAASEARAAAIKQARDYLDSTGKYSDAELVKMDFDDLKAEIADEAERQLAGNASRVDPDTIKTWIQAQTGFEDKELAKDYLVGTGRWGKVEVDRMTDAQINDAVATHAENTLMGANSAVRPEFTAEALRASAQFADIEQAKDYLVGTGRWGKVEVDRMTDAQINDAVATHAENTLMGANSAVRPEFTAEALRASAQFADIEQAKDYLMGTHGWNEAEVAGLSADELREVVSLVADGEAENLGPGYLSSVRQVFGGRAAAALSGDGGLTGTGSAPNDTGASAGSTGSSPDNASGGRGRATDPFESVRAGTGFLDTAIPVHESGTGSGGDVGGDDHATGGDAATGISDSLILGTGTFDDTGEPVSVSVDTNTGAIIATDSEGNDVPVGSVTYEDGSTLEPGVVVVEEEMVIIAGDDTSGGDTGGDESGGDDTGGDDTGGDDTGGDDTGGDDTGEEESKEESPDVGSTPTDDFVDPRVRKVVDIGRSFGIDPTGMGATATGDGHTDPSDPNHSAGLVAGGELIDLKRTLLVDPVDPEFSVRGGAVPEVGRPDSGVIDPSDDATSGPGAMGPEDDPFADLRPALGPEAPDEPDHVPTHPVHEMTGLLDDLDIEVTHPGAAMNFDGFDD